MILPLAGARRDSLPLHNFVCLNENGACPLGNFLDVLD